MTQAHVTLDDVSYHYGHHKALQDVSGVFPAGSLTAVAGPNGAGKSTLLKIIAGVMKPQKGRVTVASALKGKIGYLPQVSAIERDYPLNVRQAVSTGLWPEAGSFPSFQEGALKARVDQALADVGLQELEARQIGELSGGQFQRLLFARLIVQDPQLILLDEPFAAIDAQTIAPLIQQIIAWHTQGRTIICVLHDLLLIRKYFPESFLLAGKCMGRGHTHALFEQKLLSFDLDMAELVGPEEKKHSGFGIQDSGEEI
ncbi:MAG: ABC transporter ATP-binding protein [Bdellovibrionales bacterium]|jgi:zinc/manganese transport system ATP-binding protein